MESTVDSIPSDSNIISDNPCFLVITFVSVINIITKAKLYPKFYAAQNHKVYCPMPHLLYASKFVSVKNDAACPPRHTAPFPVYDTSNLSFSLYLLFCRETHWNPISTPRTAAASYSPPWAARTLPPSSRSR